MPTAVTLNPEAIYDGSALRQALKLSEGTLAAARRAGALRHARFGQRTIYRGAWVLDWLEAASKTAAEKAGDEQ